MKNLNNHFNNKITKEKQCISATKTINNNHSNLITITKINNNNTFNKINSNNNKIKK